MTARLGNVLYWAGCIVAVVLLGLTGILARAEPVNFVCDMRMYAPEGVQGFRAVTVPLLLAIDLEAGTVKVDSEEPGKIISSNQEHVAWAGLGRGTSGMLNRAAGEAMIETMTPPQTLFGKCRPAGRSH
jgi:hypothetical protein